MNEPMNSEDYPKRDIDEVSIASDFSIIPESFCGQEDTNVGEESATAAEAVAASMTSKGSLSSLQSRQLQPSLSSLTSYGKVLFQNLQATYTADTDIAVSYLLTESVVAKSSDRVAIYRVGFSSPQDYLAYQWAPTPTQDHSDNSLPLTVVFKASNLPKDAGEFFQFCYVTHEGRIVGVSTPLQLLAVGGAGSEGVCGVIEEEDMEEGSESMVVVRTNESVLHDKINKLEKEKERLVGEMRTDRTVAQEKQLELDEKTQQLNMCQHHLQALETKMKKETGEKCELMGRIGQVVEEKGHLEDRVRTLERSLSAANAQADSLHVQYNQANTLSEQLQEEVLQARKKREVLDQTVTSLREDLNTANITLQKQEADIQWLSQERSQLIEEKEKVYSVTTETEKEYSKVIKQNTDVSETLREKIAETTEQKVRLEHLERCFKAATDEKNEWRERCEAAEEKLKTVEKERDIHQEREEVMSKDNTSLQGNMAILKDQLERIIQAQNREISGREAAETIASDLSARLQKARVEYQTMAVTNVKLAKKVKKLRATALSVDPNVTVGALMSSSLGSNVSAWLQADVDSDGVITEATVEGRSDDTEAATGVHHTVPHSTMTRSFMPSEAGSSEVRTVCTSCSDTTRELSEAVHRKMEDIVKELTSQITSLKTQLRDQSIVQVEKQIQQIESIQQEQEVVPQETETQQEQTETQEEQSSEQEVANETVNEPEQAEVQEDNVTTDEDGERQVLYGNTFLPTAPTAPVFLPERTSNRQPTSLTSNQSTQSTQNAIPTQQNATQTPSRPTSTTPHYPGHSQPIYQIPATQQTIPATQQSLTGLLPPPLQPEATPTALQAAVMSQFVAAPPSHPGTAIQQHNTESDDEDFHSTSDNDDAPPITAAAVAAAAAATAQQIQQQTGERKLLECPLCSLSFPVSTLRLLEEHINSHLEHVCPVCSVAFQRNSQKSFEEHVHSHFSEDGSAPLSEEWTNPLDDPSGPWGQQFRAGRLLEID